MSSVAPSSGSSTSQAARRGGDDVDGIWASPCDGPGRGLPAVLSGTSLNAPILRKAANGHPAQG
ncbi:hypothetical protein GCM10008965_40510 [Methylorubrum aminovorans]|nr:hypothetical protein GCM10025880_21240 [Methylorubrum aminovorans]